ncbi:MAG TPA: class I tRNA ligase family protein, partial [bacterium]|nr:class I tRNA ligase family protein [bacterium]
CRTALAEAELEYRDRDDVSIHVGFELEAASVQNLRESGGELKSLAGAVVLIWTTTPWTLPANRAVAVNPGFNYVLAVPGNSESEDARPAIVALETLERTAAALGWKQYRVVGRIPGEKLTELAYRHPFSETACPIVPAGYVTSDEGTGCVHTAPGHGTDDYLTGVRFGLEVASPVDEEGRFTADAGGFLEGKEVFQANAAIVEKLSELGALWGTGRIAHSYPHCWRCHRPVIFRATRQWFVSLEHRELRNAALAEVDRVNWVPEWGINRIRGMIEQRPDWCISRQRNWGIPIPAFYCENCGLELLDPGVVRKVAAMFEREGADSWFRKPASEIVGAAAVCSRCGGKNFRKENDIFDVWFESGSSHRSVLMREAGLSFPADLYLEGSDQHRGWFQLSLLLSTAAEGKAPFKAVLTHGFVVDENGEKMSKSRGNFISVDGAIEKYPADILRLWFSSVDYRKDINVSLDLIGKTEDAYRKIRNTFRHALGNIAGFDPRRDLLARERMEEVDRWIMLEAAKLRDRVTEAYSAFEFHRVYRDIHNF